MCCVGGHVLFLALKDQPNSTVYTPASCLIKGRGGKIVERLWACAAWCELRTTTPLPLCTLLTHNHFTLTGQGMDEGCGMAALARIPALSGYALAPPNGADLKIDCEFAICGVFRSVSCLVLWAEE